MLVKGKYLFYGSDISDALRIREQVFKIEQGLGTYGEYDSLDDEAIHAVAYAGEEVVAAGRLIFDDYKYKIEKVAVLKEEREKKYGNFIVLMLVDKAFLSGAKEIYIDSGLDTVGFYKKMGFQICSDEYEKSGRKYITMRLRKNELCKECSKK